jgi:cytochrome c biogenesis protein CcdA
VNPCAFAAIIFLVTLLAVSGRSRRDIVVMGSLFAATVFVVYLLVGFGAMSALRQLTAFAAVSAAIRWGMVAVLVVLAALSFVDARRASAGAANEMILTLPGGIRQRMHHHMRRGVRTGSVVLGTVVMGGLVSIFELACTGQIYLPTIVYVIQRESLGSGLGYLVLYNIGFILPLCVVFGLYLVGTDRARITGFFTRNVVRIKVLLGILFLVFAALLTLT